MDQQSCNDSGDQNWKFPASPNSLGFPVSNEEASGQAKQLSEFDLSSSIERSQSTNDTTKTLSMETLKQPTQQIPECYLNNRSEVQGNAVEGNENHQKQIFYEGRLDGEDAENMLAFFSKNEIELYERDNGLSFSRNCFADEDQENVVKPIETQSDFLLFQNYLDDDSFPAVPNHGINIINMTAQNIDLNFGIAQDIGIAPVKEDKEDNSVLQSKPHKSSKPFTIIRNVKPPTSTSTRGHKKRSPKPSPVTKPNIEHAQLKIIRGQKKKCPSDWERDMHSSLERTSEQDFRALQLQNFNSDYDFCDYFRSSTDNNSPYVSESNINEMVAGFWLNPECNEVLNTFKMENPGLINNDIQNRWIQSDLMAILGDPSIAIAQPFTSEAKTTKVKKSKADPEKKLKTINATASSEPFASKKSSPFSSSTQMGSESESEDEYSESQNKRERKRKSRNIQNKILNGVVNGAVNNLPPQPQPKQTKASRRRLTDDEISKLTFGTSEIRRSFFTVVVNQKFALLKNKELGMEFRDAIKQEAWFKYLVQRANWFESVFQAYENSEKILQKEEFYHEAIFILEWYEKASQIEELNQEALQRYQVALDMVRSYEEALLAAKQCEFEMGRKWYQEALRWKNLQSVICSKKWAQVNKRTLPQDQCDKCCQSYQCDECREFENLCTLLHAIYKKGINEKGEESREIRSLERFSEIVGNERFSEADHVIEMDLKEFCQKAGSSVLATFLKEEEEFYDIAIKKFYIPQRNYEKQDDEEEVLCDDDKKMLHLKFKSDIRQRFATPKAFPRITAKK